MQRRDLFNFGRFFNNEVKSAKVLLPYMENQTKNHLCVSCQHQQCVAVCETQVIKIDEDRKPYLDFSIQGCTYCGECLALCDQGVLINPTQKIDALFSIDILSCLSWNQTMCFGCKDRCLEGAIGFIGLFRPSIDSNLCTSCGFCMAVCPSQSIVIKVGN